MAFSSWDRRAVCRQTVRGVLERIDVQVRPRHLVLDLHELLAVGNICPRHLALDLHELLAVGNILRFNGSLHVTDLLADLAVLELDCRQVHVADVALAVVDPLHHVLDLVALPLNRQEVVLNMALELRLELVELLEVLVEVGHEAVALVIEALQLILDRLG